MDVMRKQLTLFAVLATLVALPATGALAAHGGGGGHMGGGHMGGGHMGGGHMGGGFGGGHMGGSGGSHFGHAGGFHDGRLALHDGFHGRHFFGGGYDNACWNGQITPEGRVCEWPDYPGYY
jgi:hypothetical protein